MENEQLVDMIRSGRKEYIPQLWDQVEAFISMQAGKFLESFPLHFRQLQGDMVNEAYFYFLKAIDGFDPSKSHFLTYLDIQIKNGFRSVLFGGAGQRLKNDPLNKAVSINAAIEGTEDITLEDSIPDETAEDEYRRAEDQDFWRSVRGFLLEAIDHVRNEDGREILKYRLVHDCTIGEAIKGTGNQQRRDAMYSRQREAVADVYQYMRRSKPKEEMKRMGLYDHIKSYGVGVRAYRRRLFTSSTEAAALDCLEYDEILKRYS